MTEAKRKAALERIETLTTRNTTLIAIVYTADLSERSIDELKNIIAENEKTIQELIKMTDKRYEFLFNFTSGGWNSEYAFTIEEAKELAKAKYSTKDYEGNCIPDMKSFRVSTPSDYQNLMSMFY
jgi:hypothetical protein